MAKASKDDFRRMRDFYLMLEEVIECGTHTPDDGEPVEATPGLLWDLVHAAWGQRGPGIGAGTWGRVVEGANMLIANCCDPVLDYLDWRKDVREWLESQEEVSQ